MIKNLFLVLLFQLTGSLFPKFTFNQRKKETKEKSGEWIVIEFFWSQNFQAIMAKEQ